jgi:hypothetical protein
MRIKKNRVIIISLSAVILLLIAVFYLSPWSTVLLKSKSHFIRSTESGSVYYEPGAEVHAAEIAAYLPSAVKRVEQIHCLPFEESFNIYVCNTQKSFDKFIANTSGYPIRGAALLGNVFIAPSAFDFMEIDTYRETLTHELSHLHFSQRIGFLKRRLHPVWFSEGLADYIAGSGGEGTSESEAAGMILKGRHFNPEEEGEIFGSFRYAMNGLSGPVFHQQAKMFITWMVKTSPLKFRSLILALQKGECFGKTFTAVMGYDVKEKWHQFVSVLKQKYSD